MVLYWDYPMKKEVKKMGFDANEYLGSSQSLNAQMVKDKGLVGKNLLIADVTEEKYPKEDKVDIKLALHFAELDRLLVLNKTNVSILRDKFGSDTDSWGGKVIQLFLTKVMYNKELVDSIQVNPLDEQPKKGALPSSG